MKSEQERGRLRDIMHEERLNAKDNVIAMHEERLKEKDAQLSYVKFLMFGFYSLMFICKYLQRYFKEGYLFPRF